jgi:hypothetical protein
VRLLAVSLFVIGAARADVSAPGSTAASPPPALQALSRKALQALSERSFDALLELASEKGIAIGSGYHLGDGYDEVLDQRALARAWRTPRQWGYCGACGTDDPEPRRTLREYVKDVVYTRDFAHRAARWFPPAEEWPEAIRQGTWQGTWSVQYRDDGHGDYDWRELVLSFRLEKGRWRLWGIHIREWEI